MSIKLNEKRLHVCADLRKVIVAIPGTVYSVCGLRVSYSNFRWLIL